MSTSQDSPRPLSFPFLPLIALLGFCALSAWAISKDGLFGFVPLVTNEPWALQMLFDIVFAVIVACKWIAGDARRRGLVAWPFIAASFLTGSIAVLAYTVWRALAPSPARARDAAPLGSGVRA